MSLGLGVGLRRQFLGPDELLVFAVLTAHSDEYGTWLAEKKINIWTPANLYVNAPIHVLIRGYTQHCQKRSPEGPLKVNCYVCGWPRDLSLRPNTVPVNYKSCKSFQDFDLQHPSPNESNKRPPEVHPQINKLSNLFPVKQIGFASGWFLKLQLLLKYVEEDFW